MDTHIKASRIHRAVGAKIVAGKWNAEVRHTPMVITVQQKSIRSMVFDILVAIVVKLGMH